VTLLMETLRVQYFLFIPQVLKDHWLQQFIYTNRQTKPLNNVVNRVNHLLNHPVVIQNFAFNSLFCYFHKIPFYVLQAANPACKLLSVLAKALSMRCPFLYISYVQSLANGDLRGFQHVLASIISPDTNHICNCGRVGAAQLFQKKI
jgi:hypothetical protein